MFHSTRRFLNAALAVLVVFTLLLGFVKPAFAEGEVPEDAPPAAAPAPEGEESPENLEQALSDGSAAMADGGALVPLASQSELDESCVPDPWFYGTLCAGGVCQGVDGFPTIWSALDNWGAMKGVGYIYLEGTYANTTPGDDDFLVIDGSATNHPEFQTLKGIVWDGTVGIPLLTGNLTVKYLNAGFLLQGFTINGEVTFNNNKGLVMLQNRPWTRKVMTATV